MLKSIDLPKRLMLALVALLATLALAGCADKQGAPDLPLQETEYRLGPGDKVQVTVFGQEELTGEHVVDSAGNISMALIGAVPAAGESAATLEKRITDGLSPEYLNDPKVSVQVFGYRPVYIVGEVKNPGSYPYVDGMVIMNAVALAGGLTYRARDDEFLVTRNADPERVPREATPNSPVQPGDVVTVKERFF